MAAAHAPPPNAADGAVLATGGIFSGRRRAEPALVIGAGQQPEGSPPYRRAHHVHVRRTPNLASLASAPPSSHSTCCLLTFGARPNAHFLW